MNRVAPPTLPPEDDLDPLLRGFFQAQLPRPWPEAPWPAPARRAGRPLLRSRLALAASVALLLAGSLFFPVADPGPADAQAPRGAPVADVPAWLRKEARERKTLDLGDDLEGHLSLEQPTDGPTVIKIEFGLPPAR